MLVRSSTFYVGNVPGMAGVSLRVRDSRFWIRVAVL